MMKKLISIILIYTMVASFIIPIIALDGTSREVIIGSFESNVKVKKAGGERSFNAFPGMKLMQGDCLTTGENSSAVLLIDDDKKITIGANTKIFISELSGIDNQNDKTVIMLFYGKLISDIKEKLSIRSKFEIKTPTTVVGARGTMFFVGEEDGKTDCAVLEGTVVATSYIPPEEFTDGLNEATQEIEFVINTNEQVTIEPEVLSQQSQPEVQVEQVTPETLDLFVLESIQEDPVGIDQSLLNDIDQVIEQKQQQLEEVQQEQQPVESMPPPQIIYDEVVAPPPPPPPPPQPPSPDQPPSDFPPVW